MKKTKSGLLIVFLILFTFFITPKNVINIEGMTLENLYINGVSVEYRNSGISVQIPTQYVTPERELRAVWVSRFAGDIGDISTVQNFKKEYLAVLDKMEEYNLNTIIFHVRTHHDAFYRSSINKQSFRIGNINQSFDAIEWAIEETHKRGIEFHAWMNPYRIGGTSITEIQSEYADFPDNPVHNSDNILMGTNGAILNPGEPAVREFLIDTVMELIENYDVDAIHFDDYFYAKGIDDSKTMNKPGYNPKGLGVADWRREQVNIFIRDLNQAIRTYNQENNRYVQFGISPTGIYRNGGSGFAYGGSDTYDVNGNFITSGSNTSGQEHYESYLFSDTKKWVDNEWIDYIIPQSYWGFTRDVAKYADIVDWWAKVVRYKNVNLYTGTGLYMATSGSGGDSWLTNPQEITMQIRYNTKHPEILGNSIYSYKHIITPPGLSGAGLNTLKTEMWNTKVLRPVIKSMAGNPLGQVRGFSVSRNSNQNVLTWEHLLGARGYVIYRNSGEIDFNDHSQILDIVGFEEVETLSYIDQNVGNENYVYGIRALNGANELGEGTLEVEGGPSDQYTITVLTNIGQNLAYVMNTNSLYGNTNQVIIDDSNQTQYRYNFLTENNKIITYDKEYLFRVTTDHQFTAYFVEAGKIGVSFVNLNDDLISFQMVNSLEDVIYPDDPGDIGFYRFVTWSRYDISDGDIVYRAVYERIDDEHYVVNIFDGINSYQEFVKFGQIITVEKNLPHQYSYWLVDGQKHSYDEILEIAVYNDLTIELVSGQITNDGFIHLRNNIVSNDNYFIYFGKFNLPLNALLLETGILLSKNPSDNLVLTNNNIEKLRALTISPTNEFAIKKTDINYNETVYARGYLVYIDNNDDINFVYTQNFEHTKVVPKNMFLITYDLQGGTLEQYVEMFKRKDLPLNLPIPTRLGYNFIGWYDVIKGEIITEITEAKDYYLRALWEEKPTQFYEISYRLNGGSWGFTNKEDLAEAFLKDFYSYLKLEGKLTTEDLQVFMHGEGQTGGFKGIWQDQLANLYAVNDKTADASKQYFINQPEYNSKWIDFFEMMEEFTKAVNETQSFWGSTFTGHLRLKQYITGEKPADYVKDELMEMLPEVTKTATTYRSDRELILSKPIREGYKFVGWFEKEDFSGGAVEVIPAGSTENKVFYALWEPDY